MSDMREKLAELERELKTSGKVPSTTAGGSSLEKLQAEQKEKHRRALRKTTKRKILVGSAMALALWLVWMKVNIHFVVYTSFWGLLGIVGGVFLMIYLILRYFFDNKEE